MNSGIEHFIVGDPSTIPYIITHIGEGNFQVELESGKIVDAGPNLCGMIRYTYFEDFTLPEIGWKITHKKLTEDHLSKITDAIKSGKLNKNTKYF